MSVILEHVSKAYGRQKALDDIGFRLEEGEICGFLGPNGAGKSTTMKIITGCLNDYQGEVRIKEMNLRENPLKIKAIIGYLPEQNPLYPDLYIREYLLHVTRLYRVGRPVAKVNAIIERTGLEPEIQKKIGQLSKGYRQRVGLAQALVHAPASRHCTGDYGGTFSPDPGRTDDGTRSEPTGRDQAFDQRNRKKEDGVVIDPYYAGGRSDL